MRIRIFKSCASFYQNTTVYDGKDQVPSVVRTVLGGYMTSQRVMRMRNEIPNPTSDKFGETEEKPILAPRLGQTLWTARPRPLCFGKIRSRLRVW